MKDITFILTAIVLNVFGQLSIKYGVMKLGEVHFLFTQIPEIAFRFASKPFIILGFMLYVISAFCWLIALSKVDLSYAYPMLSLGYVLIIILSWRLFNENISIMRLIGITFVCLGLCFVSKS